MSRVFSEYAAMIAAFHCACFAVTVRHEESIQDRETGYLWELGRPDMHTGEFALGPDGYSEYSKDGFFVVGHSIEKEDWPYVHPGPQDAWAGSRPHEFVVCFALQKIISSGTCRLSFHLVDTHPSSGPRLQIWINERSFDVFLPHGAGDASIFGDPSQGKAHRFGITFPVEDLINGDNEIRILNKNGSWFLYDWVGLAVPEGVVSKPLDLPRSWIFEVTSPAILLSRDDCLRQCVRVVIVHLGEPSPVTLTIDDCSPVTVTIPQGRHQIDLPIEPVDEDKRLRLRVEGPALREKRKVTVSPVKRWTVFLLHHTHLDIGYTHLQPEVELKQWEYLEQAMRLAQATSDYPEGSRFKWLPEGLWAVDSYLREVKDQKRQEMIQAVREGHIGLDALYGNQLTALCRPEELMELVGYASRFSREHGIPIETAMITDVPGSTWGLVSVLAQHGVKYLSMGPNYGHRIGYTLSEYGDKPFYWISPSGKERVLCWVAGRGYSWFHRKPLREEKEIFQYLSQLAESDYPYDVVQVRYNIGGDNGPPDSGLSDFVRDWNQRYAYPRLVIATTVEAFQSLEERHGEALPELRGDFTPYWEDGAGSSALETALVRWAAERLVQAETLWTLLQPDAYPSEEFHEAWRQVLLYNEHTWGAHNSISQPQAPFVLAQWRIKRDFALEADMRSKDLLNKAVSEVSCHPKRMQRLIVFNTCSWTRSDLVRLPGDWKRRGDRVVGEDGEPVPSQRLSSGELVFVARDVPGLGCKEYSFAEDEPWVKGSSLDGSSHGLSNEWVSLELDQNSGNIVRLERRGMAGNLAEEGEGLHKFLYVRGRSPDSPETDRDPLIEVSERGDVLACLRVISEAPGCRSLRREICLIDGLDYVALSVCLDKEAVYEPEAVHIAFPFHVPEAVCRMETPFAVVRPNEDQLPGACKNYFTVQRWMDVSNERMGVTVATIEAPLWQIGRLTVDPVAVGWLRETPQPHSALYCYAMNNYWETNYKAAQEGETEFRFFLRPHGPYEQEEAYRFGLERSQPLILIPAMEGSSPELASFPKVGGEGIVVSRLKPREDGDGLMMRLFNVLDRPTTGWLQNISNEDADPQIYRMDGYEILSMDLQ